MTNEQFSPLVATVLTKMMDDTAETTNRVIDNLQAELNIAWATIDAIRDEIMRLMNQEFLPHPRSVINALYPSQETVEEYFQAN